MASKKKAKRKKPTLKPKARQLAYVAKRVANPKKPKAVCAREAGYAETTALHAGRDIENSPAIATLLKDAIRNRISADKIAQRIAEGMDAVDTKFFAHEGTVLDQRHVIAWSERREYSKLASTLGKYHIEELDLNVNDNRGERLAELLRLATERANASPDGGRASAVQSHPRG